MDAHEFTALGKAQATFVRLDTFPAPAGLARVTLRTEPNAVSARCPITGQPDQYTVTVVYVPGALCPESKAFKLYLETFRERGIFGEALAAEIHDALRDALQPARLRVTVAQSVRGGIRITSEAGDDI